MTALSAAVALTISATAGAVEKPVWVEFDGEYTEVSGDKAQVTVTGDITAETTYAYKNSELSGGNSTGIISVASDLTNNGNLWISSEASGHRIYGILASGATVTNNGGIYAKNAKNSWEGYSRAMLAENGATLVNAENGVIYLKNSHGMMTTNTNGNTLENNGIIVAEEGSTAISMEGKSASNEESNKNKIGTVKNSGTIFVDDDSFGILVKEVAGGQMTVENTGSIRGNGISMWTVGSGAENVNVELSGTSHVEGKMVFDEKTHLSVKDLVSTETLKIAGSTGSVTVEGSNVVIEHVGSDTLAMGSVSVDGASSLNFRMNSLGQQLSGTVTGEGRNGVGVVYSGDVSDELLSAPADAEKLFTNISGLTIDGEALTSVYAEEGLESDASVFVKGENGEVVQNVVGTNSLMSSAQDLAVASALMWRDQLSTLSDRMGTLRTLPSQYGSWARFTNGRLEGDTVEHDFNTLEVGFDAKVTDSFGLGASFSYTKGDSDVAAGQADNNTYTAGVYATYVNDSNCYLDAMFKLGRIDADYDLVNGAGREKADYMMTGAILGVEAGHRWNIDSFYVEPQVQVVYSHLREAGFDSNVRHVEFDVIESFITRVGVTGGMKFGEKGAAYVGLSYNHDFMGDVEGTYTRNNTRVIKTELDDNWGEARIGASYEVMNGLNAFADAAATFGGDIDQKWRFNVGARYVF